MPLVALTPPSPRNARPAPGTSDTALSRSGGSRRPFLGGGAVRAMLAALALALPGLTASAQAVRTQSVELKQGWNAVFLEVEPHETAPDRLFAGTAVEVVAAYTPRLAPVETLTQPRDAAWKQEGWAVWYAPSRPDAAASSLPAIHGPRAYLIQASRNEVWNVSGKVVIRPLRWQPNSFNLVGFGIDPDRPPTFEAFFGAAPAHRGQRCFRLVDGVWSVVRDPARSTLRPGEAYWVYSEGPSDFQGPMSVIPDGRDGLDFGALGQALGIRILNQGPGPASFLVEASGGGEGPELPLSVERRDLGRSTLDYDGLVAPLTLPPTPPADSVQVRFRVRRAAMSAPQQTTLLRISDGRGSVRWVSARAAHPDL